MQALRQQLQGHASRLAELASTKAGKDDLAALSARLTGMDRKFMDELATRARELGVKTDPRCSYWSLQCYVRSFDS